MSPFLRTKKKKADFIGCEYLKGWTEQVNAVSKAASITALSVEEMAKAFGGMANVTQMTTSTLNASLTVMTSMTSATIGGLDPAQQSFNAQNSDVMIYNTDERWAEITINCGYATSHDIPLKWEFLDGEGNVQGVQGHYGCVVQGGVAVVITEHMMGRHILIIDANDFQFDMEVNYQSR